MSSFSNWAAVSFEASGRRPNELLKNCPKSLWCFFCNICWLMVGWLSEPWFPDDPGPGWWQKVMKGRGGVVSSQAADIKAHKLFRLRNVCINSPDFWHVLCRWRSVGYTEYTTFIIASLSIAYSQFSIRSGAHYSVVSASHIVRYSFIGWKGHDQPYSTSNWLIGIAFVG